MNFAGSVNVKFMSWRECQPKGGFSIVSALGARYANATCCLATTYSMMLKTTMAGSIVNYITIE